MESAFDHLEEFKDLTGKQKKFAEEYVIDFNGTRAAIKAGYKEKNAYQIASENLRKPHIKAYIEHIQKDLKRLTRVTSARIIEEHKKIAFSNLHNYAENWVTLREWEKISIEDKAAIQEFNIIKKTSKPGVNEEIVKFKLYDKQKSMDAISKMLGLNEPEKYDFTTRGREIKINQLNTATIEALIRELNS